MAEPVFGDNLVEQFLTVAARKARAPCLWAKREGAFRPWSWERVAYEVSSLARALAAMGVSPGDRVVIVSENRPEWLIADMAIMAAGGITVPAYTTNTPEDHAYLLTHSGARAVVCSGGGLARKLLPALKQAPDVRFAVFADPLDGAEGLPITVLHWPDALALGDRQGEAALPGLAAEPDAVACFIYTSGTGGRPKGVMLTHRNILANVRGACSLIERTIGIDADEVFLSFLPLSHAYEHTCGQFLAVALGAQTYYAESAERLAGDMPLARPTLMICVPRLYEVLRQRIQHRMQRESRLTRTLFEAAARLGRKRHEQPGTLSLLEQLQDRILDRLVRRKVQDQFGGRLKAMVSGGGPLNYDVGMFFVALGLPLLQGYGQTETSPLVAVNVPGRIKIDTVGPPVEGVELRIAEDGEILVRGELVMKGYWRDEATTAAALDDGWLHTGDVGVLDADGYLKITDRKKDIIVNSGGDNISPQRVEGILALQPEIAQALVYGDSRPHLVGLIVPEAEFVRTWAREHGGTSELTALSDDGAFRSAIGEAIRRANAQLSNIEKVRKFHIMPEPFTVENHLMTPTLKLRRQKICQTHADLIAGLYPPAR